MKKKTIKSKLPDSSTQFVKTKAASKGISPWYFLIGILILVLGLYANSLKNDILTFDDNEYFQNYPEITNFSWESVKKYFSNYYVLMYQPLPVVTFALNFHFSGLDTFPLHVINLLFHLLNVVLVYKWR